MTKYEHTTARDCPIRVVNANNAPPHAKVNDWAILIGDDVEVEVEGDLAELVDFVARLEAAVERAIDAHYLAGRS